MWAPAWVRCQRSPRVVRCATVAHMVVLGNIKYTPDHDNEMECRADVHPKQKSNEMSLVIEAYTVTDPRAMVCIDPLRCELF